LKVLFSFYLLILFILSMIHAVLKLWFNNNRHFNFPIHSLLSVIIYQYCK
jgi:hypothetical protein